MATSNGSWLHLPTQPRMVFERNPLAIAICQIRFPAMLNVSHPGTVAAFQEAIQDEYPIGTPVTQFGVAINVQEGLLAGVQSRVPTVVWRFADVNDDWTVVLSQEFVSVETRSYTSFEDFERRLARVLESLSDTVRPRHYSRIGLRYINELRPDHQQWTAVIRSELLGPMTVSSLSERSSQWNQQFLLEGPDGKKLRVQQGVIPSGTTVETRAGEEAPPGSFYLLDLDSYEEFSRPLPEMSISDLSRSVRTAHDVLSEFFRWAITESYAKSLGEQDDANT